MKASIRLKGRGRSWTDRKRFSVSSGRAWLQLCNNERACLAFSPAQRRSEAAPERLQEKAVHQQPARCALSSSSPLLTSLFSFYTVHYSRSHDLRPTSAARRASFIQLSCDASSRKRVCYSTLQHPVIQKGTTTDTPLFSAVWTTSCDSPLASRDLFAVPRTESSQRLKHSTSLLPGLESLTISSHH